MNPSVRCPFCHTLHALRAVAVFNAPAEHHVVKHDQYVRTEAYMSADVYDWTRITLCVPCPGSGAIVREP